MGEGAAAAHRYTAVRELASGGMGSVHLAVDRFAAGLGRLVVIKRILPAFARDPAYARMFLNEASVASGLSHPNVGRVLDYGIDDDGQFLVLEYIHGETLQQVLRAAGKAEGLTLEDALSIVRGVAAGLHGVHEHRDLDGKPLGLVHRDTSPSNIMIGYDGGVRLIDFGIAKPTAQALTETGTLKGKVPYMSPEQCEGAKLDRRSDVFSLGVLLYECTLGVRLFHGHNEFAIMNKIRRGEYARPRKVDPQYPEALEAIVARALQVRPDDRHPTAEAFEVDLERFAQQHRLVPSTARLRAVMIQLFGERPPATLGELGVLPAADWDPAAARPSPWRRLGLIGAAALFGGGSVYLLGPEPGPATAREAAEATAPASVEGAPARASALEIAADRQATQAAKADPTHADAAKADPTHADAAKADPTHADAAKADPTHADAAKADEPDAAKADDARADVDAPAAARRGKQPGERRSRGRRGKRPRPPSRPPTRSLMPPA